MQKQRSKRSGSLYLEKNGCFTFLLLKLFSFLPYYILILFLVSVCYIWNCAHSTLLSWSPKPQYLAMSLDTGPLNRWFRHNEVARQSGWGRNTTGVLIRRENYDRERPGWLPMMSNGEGGYEELRREALEEGTCSHYSVRLPSSRMKRK